MSGSWGSETSISSIVPIPPRPSVVSPPNSLAPMFCTATWRDRWREPTIARPIPHKRGWVHSDPRMVAGLRAAGFAFMSCANNVTYPPSAALRSLAVLDAHGIPHAGAGRTRAEARRPAIVERCDLRFGLLSYTSVFWPHGHAAGPDSPGGSHGRSDHFLRAGAACAGDARRGAHHAHNSRPGRFNGPDRGHRGAAASSGLAGRRYALGYLREQRIGRLPAHGGDTLRWMPGRTSCSAPIPMCRKGSRSVTVPGRSTPGVICYSLGNFTFDWPAMGGRADGLLVRCLLDREQRAPVHVSYAPVGRNEAGQPGLLSPETPPGQDVAQAVTALSEPLGTSFRFDPAANDMVIWSALQQ